MAKYPPIENLDPIQIQTFQQNRHPLLFIDVVERAVPGQLAVGYKCFTYNEWFFPAHFSDEPVVPGFIQIESLTQMFLMTFLTIPGNEGKKTGFVGIQDTRFRRKIGPGERLDIEANLDSYKRGVAQGSARSFVGEEPACELKLTVAIPDILQQLSPRNKQI